MSDSANPFDEKRRDRTVVLPMSGDPTKETPRVGAPDVAAGPAPIASEHETSHRASQGDNVAEDWIKARERMAQPAGPVAALPEINLNDLVSPHDNPIMRAAGPLLILLGRLRAAVMRAPFAHLMEQVAEAMRFFEKDIRTAGVSEDQARSAKYVLCATADDIVQNIPTADRHVWTRYSMLARFFNERIGGVRFFDEVDRAKLDPLRNYQLLELQYTCLALGFQGVHRTSPDGQAKLQLLQRHIYEILRQVRPRVARELSPRWQGLQLQRAQGWFRIPVWTAWSVVGLLLLGLYIMLRLLLSGNAEVTIDHLRAMVATGPVDIERRVINEPPPPPPPQQQPPPVAAPPRLTQLQRIRAGLAPEIEARLVEAFQTNTLIVIRVGDLVLFPSNSATVLKQFEPIGARIASVLDSEPRRIFVIGHTDNTPISGTSRFASNHELSVERAKAVAAILKRALKDPARVVVKGRADEDPAAPNNTKEGRAKNRRVELSLERDEVD